MRDYIELVCSNLFLSTYYFEAVADAHGYIKGQIVGPIFNSRKQALRWYNHTII